MIVWPAGLLFPVFIMEQLLQVVVFPAGGFNIQKKVFYTNPQVIERFPQAIDACLEFFLVYFRLFGKDFEAFRCGV
jgi:hypothetical protein